MLQSILEQGRKDGKSTATMFKWLDSPISYWENRKPIDMIAAGHGQTVLTFMENYDASTHNPEVREALNPAGN